jgi:hypothetical protein
MQKMVLVVRESSLGALNCHVDGLSIDGHASRLSETEQVIFVDFILLSLFFSCFFVCSC